jgi:cell division protein ZipA
MDSLRLILLLIGAAIVVAIYLHSRLKKDAGEQLPGVGSSQSPETVEQFAQDEQGMIVDPSAYSYEHESVANEYNSHDTLRESDDELLELGHNIKIDETEEGYDSTFSADEVPAASPHLKENQHNGLIEKVMVIYLLAQPDMSFTGSEICRVAEYEGMQFGEDRYFHRYSNADSSSDSIFGIANILEPGLFDLSNLETFSTTGLVFFQQLSNAGGALEAFDEMLKTVIQFKEQLNGRLQDSSRHSLNKAEMIELRKQVSAFSLDNPVTPF